MYALIVAIASIGLAYLLYRSNPDSTEKWTKRGITGWYAFVGFTYLLLVLGLLLTGSPRLVFIAGFILFVMTIILLVRDPFNKVTV